MQALLRACALACRVLEEGEPGKTLLGMDVSNQSAVPRAQELRASNRLELVWSEAVLTQEALTARDRGLHDLRGFGAHTGTIVGSEHPAPALTCLQGDFQSRTCGGKGCCAAPSLCQSTWGFC